MKNIEIPGTSPAQVNNESTNEISLGSIFGIGAPSVDNKSTEEVKVKNEKPEKLLPNEENAVYIKYKTDKGKTKTDRIVLEGTRLFYFRNSLFDGFNFVKAIPINEMIKLPPKIISDKSGEELLAGFLVAALDDEEYVVKHFDDFDAETIEKIVEIVGRLNGITKKEKEQEEKKAKAAEAKKA